MSKNFEKQKVTINKNVDSNYYNQCIVNIVNDSVISNCVFNNCVFIAYGYITPEFINCSFKNNVYPKECNWEEIKTDIYKNRLPEGDLIVYKKVYHVNKNFGSDDVIAKLLIPARAKRINGASNKCRASYARVLAFYNINGKKSKVKECVSYHDYKFKYVVGKIVRPKKRFDNSVKVCSTGIHFFLTFQEAANY